MKLSAKAMNQDTDLPSVLRELEISFQKVNNLLHPGLKRSNPFLAEVNFTDNPFSPERAEIFNPFIPKKTIVKKVALSPKLCTVEDGEQETFPRKQTVVKRTHSSEKEKMIKSLKRTDIDATYASAKTQRKAQTKKRKRSLPPAGILKENNQDGPEMKMMKLETNQNEESKENCWRAK